MIPSHWAAEIRFCWLVKYSLDASGKKVDVCLLIQSLNHLWAGNDKPPNVRSIGRQVLLSGFQPVENPPDVAQYVVSFAIICRVERAVNLLAVDAETSVIDFAPFA